MTAARVWAELAVAVVAIWVAGTRLLQSGDVIAARLRLSRTWVGVVLLATVTSLPELVTGLSAVTLAATPDIAVGDALGSCVFNLLAITVLDFAQREASVFTRASQGHVLSAGFGVLLIGIVGFSILLSSHDATIQVGHVDAATPVVLVLYAIAMRTVFRYEREQRAAYTEAVAEEAPGMVLRTAIGTFVFAAAGVLAAGAALPFVADRLAAVMGWQATFVGTLFVAFATSVPELAVTIAALRIGAVDLAIGGLFGSNLFNMVVIAVDDLAFLAGPLSRHTSPLHAVSSVSALMMTGVAIVGLLYRPRTRLFRSVGWASLLLVTLYLLNAYVVFLVGSRRLTAPPPAAESVQPGPGAGAAWPAAG